MQDYPKMSRGKITKNNLKTTYFTQFNKKTGKHNSLFECTSIGLCIVAKFHTKRWWNYGNTNVNFSLIYMKFLLTFSL